jgi:hypothetical protein
MKLLEVEKVMVAANESREALAEGCIACDEDCVPVFLVTCNNGLGKQG